MAACSLLILFSRFTVAQNLFELLESVFTAAFGIMGRLAFRKCCAFCIWRNKTRTTVRLLAFYLMCSVTHPVWAVSDQGRRPPSWACSTTAWPVGDSVTECAPEGCNPSQSSVGGSIMDLNTGQTLYTHGGAYTPTQLSISDCCFMCRSTAHCNAWTYCNDPQGCGGAGTCKQFLAKSRNSGVVRGASTRPVCAQDGSWPHTLCTLKTQKEASELGLHAASITAESSRTRPQQRVKLTLPLTKKTLSVYSKRPVSQAAGTAASPSNQSKQAGSDSTMTGAPGTGGHGWVSGILAPVTSNPPCPAGLHHLGCSECAAARNVSACQQCTLKYVGPASNAVLWCGICANLEAPSALQTCISDVLKSSNSFCVQWLSSNGSSSSGTAVDLAATEQCFDCMKRTGAPASKCAS